MCATKKIVTLTIRIEAIGDGINDDRLDDFTNELEYTVTSTTDGVIVADTEITDVSVQ